MLAKHLKITHLNDQKRQMQAKLGKKNRFCTKKNQQSRAFLIDFTGDMQATSVGALSQKIDAVLGVLTDSDTVIVNVESSGGVVHGYGLAAAELARLKGKCHLIACVDKVAASGGYMVACVADEIVSAPFAIIGSIGVVSQIPNFHEFLQKNGIDVEFFKAGSDKRTVTMLAPNDDADRAKWQTKLDTIHQQFIDHVKRYRALDEALFNGDYWLGNEAKTLGLVDSIGTKSDTIAALLHSHEVYHVDIKATPKLLNALGVLGALGKWANGARFFN